MRISHSIPFHSTTYHQSKHMFGVKFCYSQLLGMRLFSYCVYVWLIIVIACLCWSIWCVKHWIVLFLLEFLLELIHSASFVFVFISCLLGILYTWLYIYIGFGN
jgi:hypothetical protein